MAFFPQVSLVDTTQTEINPATKEKQDEIKSVLQGININTSGLALEATLSSLNGKVPADPAREGGNLATLAGKDFATQATLAALLAQLNITLTDLRDGIKGINTLTDIYNQIATQNLASAFLDFGSSGNIGQNINDEFLFNNVNGYSSIAFRVVPPTGGTVIFEGSFDGDNWDMATMRSTLQDEYIATANTTDFLIGSISAMRKFRIRTTVAGSVAGTIKGRAQRDASTIESTEFSQRPDKIGALLVTKGAQYTTQQTNTVLWTPATGKRFYVTSYKINAYGSTDGTITVFDETNAVSNWISPPVFYDVTVNNAIIDREDLTVPFKSSAIGNSVKLTSSSAINFSIILRGYETP